MKKLLLAVMVIAMVAVLASPSNAQSKISLSVGPDILLPLGTFGDAYSIGFGGTVRGQYDFTPMISAGLEAGYFTFSAKSVPAGQTAPSFHAIPVRLFGKYYFMPEGPSARFYGMVELGFWFSSVTVTTPATPGVTIPGVGTFGGSPGGSFSSSSTDFNYVPAVGVEFPMGKVKLDVSVRYDGVATSGSSTSLIGGRVAVNFPI